MNIHHVDVYSTVTQGVIAAQISEIGPTTDPTIANIRANRQRCRRIGRHPPLRREAPECGLDFVIVRFHQQFPDIFTGL